jgi:glycosyltransferase involved in cell wall biosynthesis
VLPVDSPGGGANVVISESLAIQRMGVEVTLFNTHTRRGGFERGYPNLAIPVIYGEEIDLPRIGQAFDAVIATYYPSVYWMQPLAQKSISSRRPVLGYYIQDYEALFFVEDSSDYQVAKGSYTAIPELHCFTKTAWNQRTIAAATGVTPTVIGPSVDLDTFRPRPKKGESLLEHKPQFTTLHVVAMVRPSSLNRSPELTMNLLRDLHMRFGRQVKMTIFGVDLQDPGLAHLPQDFPCNLVGVIDPDRVARLLADADIFVDFSIYQAMGLTAMEAMAAGCAVIVPVNGGSTSFARDEENALVVNTASREDCWNGLMRLVQDDELRQRLQLNAIRSICRFHPEQAAYNILDLLFGYE